MPQGSRPYTYTDFVRNLVESDSESIRAREGITGIAAGTRMAAGTKDGCRDRARDT